MILRTLLGHICPLCLSKSQHYICLDCQRELPLNSTPCLCCALPLESETSTCPDCITQPKEFTASVSPLLYCKPTDRLIQQLKTRQPLTIARALSPILVEAIHQRYRDERLPDAMVPVPLHWRKRFLRGFNQSLVLSEDIHRQTGIPIINATKAKYRSESQKLLRRKQRVLSQRKRFSCHLDLNGKHLAVIDDVVTSCSTVAAITRTLLEAGASRVDVWSLARTPKPPT